MKQRLIVLLFMSFVLLFQVAIASDDTEIKAAQGRAILRAFADARRNVTPSTYEKTRSCLHKKIMEINPDDYQEAIVMSFNSNASPRKSPSLYDRMFRVITPSDTSSNGSPTRSPSFYDRVFKVITPSSSSNESKDDYEQAVFAVKILLIKTYDYSVDDLKTRSLRKWS